MSENRSENRSEDRSEDRTPAERIPRGGNYQIQEVGPEDSNPVNQNDTLVSDFDPNHGDNETLEDGMGGYADGSLDQRVVDQAMDQGLNPLDNSSDPGDTVPVGSTADYAGAAGSSNPGETGGATGEQGKGHRLPSAEK